MRADKHAGSDDEFDGEGVPDTSDLAMIDDRSVASPQTNDDDSDVADGSGSDDDDDNAVVEERLSPRKFYQAPAEELELVSGSDSDEPSKVCYFDRNNISSIDMRLALPTQLVPAKRAQGGSASTTQAAPSKTKASIIYTGRKSRSLSLTPSFLECSKGSCRCECPSAQSLTSSLP